MLGGIQVRTTGLPDYGTTGRLDHGTTGLPDHGTTGYGYVVDSRRHAGEFRLPKATELDDNGIVKGRAVAGLWPVTAPVDELVAGALADSEQRDCRLRSLRSSCQSSCPSALNKRGRATRANCIPLCWDSECWDRAMLGFRMLGLTMLDCGLKGESVWGGGWVSGERRQPRGHRAVREGPAGRSTSSSSASCGFLRQSHPQSLGVRAGRRARRAEYVVQ